jgi:hypothetical protein
VLTTQNINAIRKSVHYVRSKSLPKLPKSAEEAQDSLDKIDSSVTNIFVFHFSLLILRDMILYIGHHVQ